MMQFERLDPRGCDFLMCELCCIRNRLIHSIEPLSEFSLPRVKDVPRDAEAENKRSVTYLR